MNNKYYTPTIEEFHVGFEYETRMYYKNDPIWTKGDFQDVVDGDWYNFEVKNCRVKHLDREDIEGLGWEFDKNYSEMVGEHYSMVFSKKVNHRGDDKALMMIYNTSSTWMLISINSKEGVSYLMESKTNEVSIPIITVETNNTLFAGKTKNKSELKRLLKQIGV